MILAVAAETVALWAILVPAVAAIVTPAWLVLVRKFEKALGDLGTENSQQHADNLAQLHAATADVITRIDETRGALNHAHQDLKSDISVLDGRVSNVEHRVTNIESPPPPGPAASQ